MPNKKITFRRARVLEKIQRGPIRYATLAGSHAYAVRKRLRPIIDRLESAGEIRLVQLEGFPFYVAADWVLTDEHRLQLIQNRCKPVDGCMVWTGYIDPRRGPMVRFLDESPMPARRAIWQIKRGPLEFQQTVRADDCCHEGCVEYRHMKLGRREDPAKGRNITLLQRHRIATSHQDRRGKLNWDKVHTIRAGEGRTRALEAPETDRLTTVLRTNQAIKGKKKDMAHEYSEDTKPNVEERYSSATHTSNLRVEAERSGPADVLIAAGWSPSRLGSAMMRLHSEWDGAEKPRRPTREAIELIAASRPRIIGFKLDIEGAKAVANDWYMHEMGMLLQKLKTMQLVRQQLVLWAEGNQISDAEKRVAGVMCWWLDHICPACDGLGKERIPGTPSLSHRDCKMCRGTRETRIPHQAGLIADLMESKKLLQHMDVCVKTARTAMKLALRRSDAANA